MATRIYKRITKRLGLAVFFFAGVITLAARLGGATEPPTSPATRKAESLKPDASDQARPVPFAQLGSARFRHFGQVFHVAFAPDGKTLATAALGSVSIWETATGKLLRRIARAQVPFHRVAYTADGKTLYAVIGPTKDGCELLTLDPATGQERRRMAIRNVVYRGAEFSPNGGRLAVFSMQEPQAVLINPADGKELARVSTFYRGNGFTPDGKRLVLAGGAEAIREVDATTGKLVRKLKPGAWRPEWVRFTSNGAVLFGGHNWVKRWDLKRNRSLWSNELLASGRGLEISPDGKRVMHVSSYGIYVFDVATGKQMFRVFGAPGDACTAARFSPDGRTLAVTSMSGLILRDAATGKPLPQSSDPLGMVYGLTFSHDSRRLSAVVGEQWVSWDLTPAVPNPRPALLARFAALAPGGRVAVRPDSYLTPRERVEFINPATGKQISRLDPPETGDTVIISVADRGLFSGDGRRFVALRQSKRDSGEQQRLLGLAVWDVATGKRIARWPKGRAVASSVAVSPDGKAVAVLVPGPTALANLELALWEPDTGRIRWKRPLDLGTPFVQFTRGGSWLVAQEIRPPSPPEGFMRMPAGAGPLVVLDVATGKEAMKVHGMMLGLALEIIYADEMYFSIPTARAVSPNGRTAAFSDAYGTLYLWELATDRERCLFAHPGPVSELAFSPDGRLLAAASRAAPVVVYDLYGTRRRAPR